jgi:hypothetical protein
MRADGARARDVENRDDMSFMEKLADPESLEDSRKEKKKIIATN